MPITHAHVMTGPDPIDPDVVGTSKWNAAHTNPDIVDVTGLTAALAGKSDVGHTHPPSGSDPWTYVKLAADFPTTSATAVDVTGMAFTPLANTNYEFSGILLVRTAANTTNPRVGWAWPTGMTDGVIAIHVGQSVGTHVVGHGNINAAALSPVGGLPNSTQSWPVTIHGMAIAGAGPSGIMRLQFASETNGTNVTMKAGSFIRYRTIP